MHVYECQTVSTERGKSEIVSFLDRNRAFFFFSTSNCRWYVKANQLNPRNGRPYNQLAILAVYGVSIVGSVK